MFNRKKEKKSIDTDTAQKGKSVLPGAILMALIVAVVLYFVMINVEKNVLANYEKGQVIITGTAVPQNTLITEENAGAYFKSAELDKNIIPDNAITDLAELYGKAPYFELAPKTALSSNMFKNIDEIAAGMKEPKLMAISTDGVTRIVNGIIRSGDMVDIYIVEPSTEGEQSEMGAETESGTGTETEPDEGPAYAGVYVQEAFDGAGVSIPNEDKTSLCQNINVLFEASKIHEYYEKAENATVYVVKHID